MHQQRSKIEQPELSPSFNCYSSETLISKSIAKVIHEDEDEDEDFEFSIIKNHDVSSHTNSQRLTPFPVFNVNLLPTDNLVHETDPSFSIIDSLNKLFLDDADETSSYSSSSSSSTEVHDLENIPSGTFCVWRPKCKKSSSTGSGSGSKRWGIRYLLRRSNSEGKEPMMLLSSKKTDSPKQKRRSGEVMKGAGKWKVGTTVHERFYVERRAEKEVGKRKSYLPYRKDLVGLSFASVNGVGKMFPF